MLLKPNQVNELIKSYPPKPKQKLQELRTLILEVAANIKGVGKIEECLKWNELSFVTSETKSGSTIRIDWKKSDPERYHLYVNCQTQLVRIYKELFPDDFEYGGNRSISFSIKKNIPKRKLKKMIEIALTYNLNNYKDLI